MSRLHVQAFLDLLEAGKSLEHSANLAGTTRQAVYKRRAADPEFARRLEQSRRRGRDLAERREVREIIGRLRIADGRSGWAFVGPDERDFLTADLRTDTTHPNDLGYRAVAARQRETIVQSFE